MRCRSFARRLPIKPLTTWPALPVLFGAQAAKLIAADEAIDDGLNVVQRASQTSPRAKPSMRWPCGFPQAPTGSPSSCARIRTSLARPPTSTRRSSPRSPTIRPNVMPQRSNRSRDRIAAIAKERDDLQAVFTRRVSRLRGAVEPATADGQGHPGAARRRRGARHRRARHKTELRLGDHPAARRIGRSLRSGADDVAKAVSTLRAGWISTAVKPFDTQASFELYRNSWGRSTTCCRQSRGLASSSMAR